MKLFLWVWYGPSIVKLVYVYVFSSSWNQELQIDFKYLLAYTFLDSLYVKKTTKTPEHKRLHRSRTLDTKTAMQIHCTMWDG